MFNNEIKIDNDRRTITFGTEIYDIGVSLLSFIETPLENMDNEHPYIKYFKEEDKPTLEELQRFYDIALDQCLRKINLNYVLGLAAILETNRPTNQTVNRLYDFQSHEIFNNIHEIVQMQYRAEEEKDGICHLYEVYCVCRVSTVCYIEFMKMVQFGVYVRVCKNCERYFMTKGDYDVKYCDHIPKGEKRTCQQIGSINDYKKRAKANPVLAEYRKIYRRFNARKHNGMITAEQFTAWTEKAVKIRDKALQENITLEQFISDIDGISI